MLNLLQALSTVLLLLHPHHGKQQKMCKFAETFKTNLTRVLFFVGWAAKCVKDVPAVKQTQVGFEQPPKFAVTIQNSCPTCPVINIHVKCGAFSQSLADPGVFRVVRADDCVVNGGLPLGPLQSVAFNYTHQRFQMSPKSWSYQCE